MQRVELAVFLDFIDAFTAEGRQALTEALAARPEPWLQVPAQAAVALPWRETSFGWARYDVSRVKVLEVESTEEGWKVLVDGVYLRSLVEGSLHEARLFETCEEAQAAGEAALLKMNSKWSLL